MPVQWSSWFHADCSSRPTQCHSLTASYNSSAQQKSPEYWTSRKLNPTGFHGRHCHFLYTDTDCSVFCCPGTSERFFHKCLSKSLESSRPLFPKRVLELDRTSQTPGDLRMLSLWYSLIKGSDPSWLCNCTGCPQILLPGLLAHTFQSGRTKINVTYKEFIFESNTVW